jgi:hypothetical protein
VKFSVLLLTIVASAQDPPYPLVQIYREQVKPGAMTRLVNIEESAARFCAAAHCPNPYLAISSVTGPNEICWINGADSPDTLEKVWHDYAASDQIMQRLNDVASQKADLVFPATVLLARFHPEMSFYTTPIPPRYISISTVVIRPGNIAGFRAARVRLRSALERAGRPQWVYQVTSGAEDVTFLVMTPARTLQEIQTTPSADDAANEAIVTSETRLYAVSPSMSMPAQSWIDADPDFWKHP